MRSIWIIWLVSVLCFASGAAAQQLYVEYEAETLPAEDPIAPWTSFGPGCELSIGNGMLTINNPDHAAWEYFQRFEPTLTQYTEIQIEARLKVPECNEWPGSPQLSLYDYRDEGHTPGNIGHLWYGIDCYVDRIEFTKADNDVSPPVYTVLATIPVPDFSAQLHVIGMNRILAGTTRSILVHLDGQQVASVIGEPVDRPIDAAGFGYGRAYGMGQSIWDYVRYWSVDPVPTEASTWGQIKNVFH